MTKQLLLTEKLFNVILFRFDMNPKLGSLLFKDQKKFTKITQEKESTVT